MNPREWCQRVPWTMLLVTAALLLVGFSGLTRGDELAAGGDYASRQLVWMVLAIPAMIAATLFPYRSLKRWSYGLFAVSLLLLVAVYFLPPRNGARRWIPLGFMYFQPSELAKLAYILALSHYLSYRRNHRRLTGLLVPFALTLVPIGLILREPDLGTSLLFLPVLFAMLFAAGARPRHLAFVAVLGAGVLPALWLGMSAEQKSRVVTLFTQSDGGEAPKGDGYHLHQSKQVLALGGLWGRHSCLPESGRLESLPHEAYHLPAARTDFVFCLVGERFGLLGTLLTLLLYLALFGRGLMIAAGTREPFGRLLAVGIVALIATQTLINAGMTVGLMPITGMTLPLMSYGGSSLVFTCAALGLLMNVGMRPGYEVGPDPFRFSARRAVA